MTFPGLRSSLAGMSLTSSLAGSAAGRVLGFGAGFEITLPSRKKTETRRKSWKRASLFSAPNPSMHQSVFQKRDQIESGLCPYRTLEKGRSLRKGM